MNACTLPLALLLLSPMALGEEAAPEPASSTGVAGAEPEFVIIDLGALGTGRTEPVAVNNAGEVVGHSYTGEISPEGRLVRRAFLWLPAPAHGLPAGMNDLGTLRSHPLGSSLATDITNGGRVVGSSETDEPIFPGFPEPAWLGFSWRDGVISSIGSSAADPYYESVQAVNASGDMAVTVSHGFDCSAYLWLPAARYGLDAGFHELPTLEGLVDGLTFDINSHGQIAGHGRLICDAVGVENHPFLWLPEAAFGLPAGIHDVTPPGLPATAEVTARGLNDQGDVVGTVSGFDGLSPGFLWSRGVTTSLPFRAAAINEQGWIVGSHEDGAALWRDGRLDLLVDLVPAGSGWTFWRANDINDRGQITVVGSRDGRSAALLLVPVQVLFSDGFESGTTGAWDVTMP